MQMLSQFVRRIAMLFRRSQFDRDLQEEIRLHLEQREQDQIENGIAPEEAYYSAQRQFGNALLIGERSRDMWGWNGLEQLLQDVRYGARTLVKNPGFTAVAVIALALGIGANTAIFSVVNSVLLRPLAYKDSDQLVVILHGGTDPIAPANFLDWRRQNHVFEGMGAAEYWTPTLTAVERPEQLWALRVTPDIFPILGVQPLLGRAFLPDEDQAGKDREVVISYSSWQQRFGGDAKIVGRPMTLDGQTYTIVGVMPRDFKFAPFWATKAELWVPLVLGDRMASRTGASLRIFARLAPGINLAQARAEMATITARLNKEYPGTNKDIVVRPLKDKVVGDVRPALLVLWGAVGFVLLIACANVAHMLLARGAVRQKEIAVRTALGARRGRVIRQFLTESILLAMVGGVAGLLLAFWGIRVLVALSPAGIPRVETIGLDARVLWFMLAVSLLTGIAFGLFPALQASRVSLNDSLKEGGRGSTESIGRNRMRSLLVASEFALALILLIGAGLMIRSLIALQAIDPGFSPHHLLTMVVQTAGSKAGEPANRTTFFGQLLERVRALPGVQSASFINHLPLAGDIWGLPFWVEGRPIPPPGEGMVAVYRVVMPGYFHAMEIPILRGRDISEADHTNAPGVVVINEALANRVWPGEDPIGRQISLDDPNKSPNWLTIIGVTRNARQNEWAAPSSFEIYLPFLQNHEFEASAKSAWSYLTLVARSTGDPAALFAEIESEVRSLDRNVAVSQVQTMDQVVADSTAQPRFYVMLLASFAAVAMVLAAVGIYGVMSYSVSRRTHEIGIRMALGAGRREVLRLVVGQGMILALAGAAVGLLGALALTRLMATLLYGVKPYDPATFLVVSCVLCLVALAANYFPARRATKIDPMVALRHE
jgi:putative ABC transport system permease protein